MGFLVAEQFDGEVFGCVVVCCFGGVDKLSVAFDGVFFGFDDAVDDAEDVRVVARWLEERLVDIEVFATTNVDAELFEPVAKFFSVVKFFVDISAEFLGDDVCVDTFEDEAIREVVEDSFEFVVVRLFEETYDFVISRTHHLLFR